MADLSPEAWRDRLEPRLHTRWSEWEKFDRYYRGHHDLSWATQKWSETFASRFGQITDNYCPIVVDSAVERLAVQGFRFGQEQSADTDAWDIWQANDGDAQSEMAHTEAVKLGESYWIVEPPASPDDPPRLTAEHPSQVIVAHVPGDRRRRMAALKKWTGEDRHAYATVYLPDRIVKWRSEKPLQSGGYGGKITWVENGSGPNPLGVVPVIPLPNAPSMMGGGRSDLAEIIDLQDAVNKVLADMLIGSEYQAFPQRVLTGVEVPRDENGVPLKSHALKAATDRVWAFANENVGASEFSAADLSNYIAAKDSLVNDLAAQVRLPPQYVKGELTNASADALKMADMGLVNRTRRKMPAFGRGHVEALQLAFLTIGDTERAAETVAHTIWVEPESRSPSATVDAALKQKELGVPNEVLWEKIGYTPQEIERMKAATDVDALLTLAAEPPPGTLTPGAETPAEADGASQ